MCPTAKIFLDVDDLSDIQQLEAYIEASACVLAFISRGYFASKNCLRELQASKCHEKAMILVYEPLHKRGGGQLQELRTECPPHLDSYIFQNGYRALPYERAAAFQEMVLLSILADCLHLNWRAAAEPMAPSATPSLTDEDMDRNSSTCNEPPSAQSSYQLYREGSSNAHSWKIMERRELYCSTHNPGAREVALLIQNVFGREAVAIITERKLGYSTSEVSLEVSRVGHRNSSVKRRSVSRTTDSTVQTFCRVNSSVKRRSVSKTTARSVQTSSRVNPRQCAPTFLLFLNEHTFQKDGEADALADELRAALARDEPILLVQWTPVPFDHFFTTTPTDLLVMNLYRNLAVPLSSHSCLQLTSIVSLGKHLGAVRSHVPYHEWANHVLDALLAFDATEFCSGWSSDTPGRARREKELRAALSVSVPNRVSVSKRFVSPMRWRVRW